jgi:gluconate 2-dehydrogenase gamma chain
VAEEDGRPQAGTSHAGRFTRREFVAGGASALVVVGAAGILIGGQRSGGPAPGPPPPLRFLRDDEGKVITALAERIFPADDAGPGATDLRVTTYIDGQLAADWGQGARMYRQGPFETPTDTGHGWQHDLTPSRAFRQGLAALDEHCKKAFGKSYDALGAARQDEVLTALQLGKVDTFSAPTSIEFFGLIRQAVLEGLFSDPYYGGNLGMGGWKWLGYPGDPMAYNDPYEKYVDNWVASYDVEPKSMYS